MTAAKQGAIWLGLWGFWVWVSRHNHPTLLIDGVATALLLAAFAAAVYGNWHVLVPRFWAQGRRLAYWACLLVMMNILTAIDVVVIGSAYDVLWEPDVRRFGFWINYALEFAGMTLHLAGAAVIVKVMRRRQLCQPER